MNKLTDKQIILELIQWHEINIISKNSNISKKLILDFLKSKNDSFKSNLPSIKLRSYFSDHINDNIMQICISDLKKLVIDNKNILIDTPDGMQQVITWFNKKQRDLIKISTACHIITCSVDHLIETDFGWVAAGDLSLGDNIFTKSGFQPTTGTEPIIAENVYDFEVDHENHRYWSGGGISSHNSGKSFLSSNIAKTAQDDGAFILCLDTENAIDVEYLSKIGISLDEDKFLKIDVGMIEDVNSIMSDFFKGYKAENTDLKNARPVMVILDSLAMLSTSTEVENFDGKGEIKGDQGQRAKRTKGMLRMICSRIAQLPITMIVTDHVYPADPLLGQGKWAITNSTRFAMSIIAVVESLKLKDDSGSIAGVRMRVESYKSRFTQIGNKIEMEIPYDKRMSPTTGIWPLLEKDGVVTKVHGGWSFIDPISGDIKKLKESTIDLPENKELLELLLDTATSKIAAKLEEKLDTAEIEELNSEI